MKLQQVNDNCFAVLNEKNPLCDANSGLINLGGGVVVDTQADLSHARRMIELFARFWPGMPRRVIDTHEDGDHVWGNQLFESAEIIAHRTVPDRMKQAADPRKSQKLLDGVDNFLSLSIGAPGVPLRSTGDRQATPAKLRLQRDQSGAAQTLFYEQCTLDLDGTQACLTHGGPCRQTGGSLVRVPVEGVVFAGDVVFRQCTPVRWTGHLSEMDRGARSHHPARS